MSSKWLAPVLASLLLAGCAAPLDHAPALGADFGEAVKYNAAIQTINPDPVYPASAAEAGTRGDLGAAAVKRLRTDTVKQPQVETTEAGGVTGGSSGPR